MPNCGDFYDMKIKTVLCHFTKWHVVLLNKVRDSFLAPFCREQIQLMSSQMQTLIIDVTALINAESTGAAKPWMIMPLS